MKIVVVGTGIGGISAAYHLIKDGHEVVMVEKNDRLGGHTFSIDIDGEAVDLGFMMFGDSNPNIKAWFKSLGITKSDGTTEKKIPMALSVSSDVKGDLQFSSRQPFESIWDIFNSQKWRILIDIFKFTEELRNMPEKKEITTKEWSVSGGYSHVFFRHYFLPFTSILWTIPLDDVLNLPASQFLRCLKTHAHSLYLPLWQVVLSALGFKTERPRHFWWYIGSGYLKPFLAWMDNSEKAGLGKGSVKYNSKVVEVGEKGSSVKLESGEVISCDHVVLACHAETSADLIDSWYPEAAQVLKKYYFHKGTIYVHRDETVLPENKKSWCSWNVRITEQNEYILTYWMNRIQRLESKQNVFVTIVDQGYDGKYVPDQSLIIKQFPWDHPRLLADCVPYSELLPARGSTKDGESSVESIVENGISLSGAWLGRGFHEDGFVAGRRVAAVLRDAKNVSVPLYEDEENIAIPPVKPFSTPFIIRIAPMLLSAAAAIALGVFVGSKLQ